MKRNIRRFYGLMIDNYLMHALTANDAFTIDNPQIDTTRINRKLE